MAELRKDPVSGDWVISGYSKSKPSDTGECPFCPGNERLTPKQYEKLKALMVSGWSDALQQRAPFLP